MLARGDVALSVSLTAVTSVVTVFTLPLVVNLIEVGMQNVAQAMAVAASPFLMADASFAVPAVIYAVIMNAVLLGYLAWLRFLTPVATAQQGCER